MSVRMVSEEAEKLLRSKQIVPSQTAKANNIEDSAAGAPKENNGSFQETLPVKTNLAPTNGLQEERRL
jgi:hypothetical protein